MSLAHHGVLFLDELLEFPRGALESLRQPLEDGRVVIARAASSVAFPARFSLVAAMNPCPCGNAGEPTRVCTCAESEIVRYRSRLSGPLADRIDMHVTLGAVSPASLSRSSDGESSSAIRARVEASRVIQRRRYADVAGVRCNAHAAGRWLLSRGCIDDEARTLLGSAMESLKLSARGYHRVLRVARTIADLEGSATWIRRTSRKRCGIVRRSRFDANAVPRIRSRAASTTASDRVRTGCRRIRRPGT